MINKRLWQCLGVLWIPALLAITVNADAVPLTGGFKGQGRGCWGSLYVREKTVQWTTPYSICKPTAYTVVEHDLTTPKRSIAFELARRSAQCRYAVIELSFDPETPDYWLAKGYASLNEFKQRKLASDESKLRTLSCAVQKKD